jgi:2-haloacid dehalogenase
MAIKAIVFDAYGTLFDVHSVAGATETAFPGQGEAITQIWRLKQLEYSWLRAMMNRYADFGAVTRDSLRYTLETLGLTAEPAVFEALVAEYNRLSPYSETADALAALSGHRLAILSNGSPSMLDALVRHSGFGRHFEAVISVDAARTYKPDPRAYALVEQRLNVRPDEVLFVTANGFDTAGASSFGFRVARIERVSRSVLRQSLAGDAPIGPAAMFGALRMRTEVLGHAPAVVVGSLLDLPGACE